MLSLSHLRLLIFNLLRSTVTADEDGLIRFAFIPLHVMILRRLSWSIWEKWNRVDDRVPCMHARQSQMMRWSDYTQSRDRVRVGRKCSRGKE